jgi:arsenate reductase
MSNRWKILFLCTGNSCRSQMAEGFAKHMANEFLDVFSAGVEAKGLDPYAVAVMKEVGIDISNQRSKTIGEIGKMEFDYVITLCDAARKSCPFFPAKVGVIHQGFDDPPALAAEETDEQEILKHYRKVRDEIRKYVETLPAVIKSY